MYYGCYNIVVTATSLGFYLSNILTIKIFCCFYNRYFSFHLTFYFVFLDCLLTMLQFMLPPYQQG